MASLAAVAENALRTLLPDLVEHLDPCLVNGFFARDLITQSEMETIEAGESRTAKNNRLLKCLRRRRSVKVMWTVISLLEGEHGKDKKTHEVILTRIAKGIIKMHTYAVYTYEIYQTSGINSSSAEV